MRTNIDDLDARGLRIVSGLKYGIENLAISADQTIAQDFPTLLAYDPASTNRNVTMYTPSPTNQVVWHKLINISVGTGQLVVKSPAAAVIGTLDPGSSADLYWINATLGWMVFVDAGLTASGNANKLTVSLYVPLATVVNTNVIAATMPFNGTLTSLGFRTKIPVATGGKAATLTAQINATPVTGGVLSLTSANCTPTDTLVASTAITALNTFVAGNRVGALASAVTAFSEGDGYVEFGVTRSNAP